MGSFNQARSSFYAKRRIERVQYRIDWFEMLLTHTDWDRDRFNAEVKKYREILARLNSNR